MLLRNFATCCVDVVVVVVAVGSYRVAAQTTAALSTKGGFSELQLLFETLDKDGDGKVTSKEWGSAVSENQELLSKYFGGATLAEIGGAFKRIDTNCSGSLDWDEFVEDSGAYTDATDKLATSVASAAMSSGIQEDMLRGVSELP